MPSQSQPKTQKSSVLPNPAGAPAKLERRMWGLSSFWWAVLTFWIVVALAAGLETVLLQTITRREALVEILSRLVPWLFMTALIIRISSEYTIERNHWRRPLVAYLLAFVVSLGVVALCTLFNPLPPLLIDQHHRLPQFVGGPHSVTFVVLVRMTYQVPTFWGLVAVAHAVRFYEHQDFQRWHETELRAQLSQARLQALQLQLNPHFLFNTLNSVASLIPDNPAGAEQMIEALGDLLRIAITTDRQTVPLREELHFLNQYLLIQHIRFGDRVQIQTRVEEELLDDAVPILILQPLVENALKHGVENVIGSCLIKITVEPAGEGHFLRMEVSNTGPRLEPPPVRIEERVGLSNTRARLQTLFGDRASLELHPQSSGGFVARILMPRNLVAKPAPPRPLETPV